MIEPSRSLEQRTADVLARLRDDVDLWVASADAEGNAYLVPLSFVWDGAALTISTPRASRTARNLMRAEWARVALGQTRDVAIVEGTVETITIGTDPALEDATPPRRGSITGGSRGVRLSADPPREIQAWREANELSGRQLMRAGRWLVDARPRR